MTHTSLIRQSMLAAVFFGLAIGTVQAGVIININQVGSDVVATGGGTLDLTDLTQSGGGNATAAMIPSSGEFIEGPATGFNSILVYSGATGPATLGPGAEDQGASSGNGAVFGIGGRSATTFTSQPRTHPDRPFPQPTHIAVRSSAASD